MNSIKNPGILIVNITAVLIAAQNPWDLLPASNQIAGWIIDAESTGGCSRAQVTIPDSLSQVINGSAPVYTTRGFVNGAFEGYSNADAALCVEIYNQGAQANALLVYAFKGRQMYDTLQLQIPGAAAAHADTGSSFSYVADMVAGQFYVRVRSPSDEIGRSAAGDFLRRIASRSEERL
jgi:hypothetical protein